MARPPTPSALRAFLDAVLEQSEHGRTLRFCDWSRGAAASAAIGALGAGGCDRSIGVPAYGVVLVRQEHDCSNGADDDGDGTIDCGDTADCCGHSNCVRNPGCPAATGGGPNLLAVAEFDCADDRDEDTDGRADCDDPDCTADAACRGAGGAAGAGGAGTVAGSAGRGGAQ